MTNIALLLVDVQRDFWEPLEIHSEFSDFPVKIGKLLEYARKKQVKVIHVRSVFKKDRSDWMLFYRPEGRGTIPCIEGTEGAEFTTFAEPNPGETIITKRTFDAFKNTDLQNVIKENKLDAVLIAGLETSVCVLFTATSAYQNNILPVVVSDACADEPGRHRSTLQMYTDLCFKTATLNQLQTQPKYLFELVNQFTKSTRN
jgi:nicotinamidase-related amidase